MWAEITGEIGYWVSDRGEVKSQRKTLSPWGMGGGQRAVKIRRKTYLVHLLVLAAFVGPRPQNGAPQWINGDQSDNRLVNLRWWTPNTSQAATVKGRYCRNGHLYVDDNTLTWGKGNRVCMDCEKGAAPVIELPEAI